MGSVRRRRRHLRALLYSCALLLAGVLVVGANLDRVEGAVHGVVQPVMSSRFGQQVQIGSWELGSGVRLVLRDVRLRSVSGGVVQSAELPRVEITPAVQWRLGLPIVSVRMIAAHPEIVLSTSPGVVTRPAGGADATTSQTSSGGRLPAWMRIPATLSLQDAVIRTVESEAPVAEGVQLHAETMFGRLALNELQGRIGPARLSASGRYDLSERRWEASWTLRSPVVGLDTSWTASGVGLQGEVDGQLTLPRLQCDTQGVVALDERRGAFQMRVRHLDAGGEVQDVVLTRVSATMPTWQRLILQGQADAVQVAGQTGHGRFVALASVIESRRELRGVFQGYDWTIGRSPLPPLRGQFSMTPDRVALRRVAFGRAVQLDGELLYNDPASVRAEVTLDRVLLAQFAGAAGPEEPSRLAGSVSGTLRIDGKLPTPWIYVSLRSTEGGFGAMKYQSALLQFDGPWPTVQFRDSAFVSFAGTPLRVQGNMDLRELGKPTVFRHVQLVTAQGSTSWEGWELEPHAGNTDKLAVSRYLGEDWQLGFKAYLQGDRDQPAADADELQVRYRLNDFQNMRLGVTKAEEFMGMEHRWQF